MESNIRKWLAVLTALILALNIGFAAAEAQPEEESAELFGSPWINSMVIGNLPAEAASARDDFYMNENYDELAAHQEQLYMPILSASQLQPAVIGMIHDESFTAPGMDQLRIFWEQALDDETLRKEGYSGVQPYIERIMAATSIGELNGVLLADDFPFSPYLFMTVAPESMRSSNIAVIIPALALSDDPMSGIEYYDAPAAGVEDLIAKMPALNLASRAETALRLLGYSSEDCYEEAVTLYNTEVSYVSLFPNTNTVLNGEYGTIAKYGQTLTMEEAGTLCASFPLAETLKKFGKDVSPLIYVETKDWLTALDEIWTDENLYLLQMLTAYKVLLECSCYICQDDFNAATPNPLIGEGIAWNACDRAPTFSSLLAQLYAENGLDSGIREKLTEVTKGLTEEYRKLFNETEWISGETRDDAIEKLDHIRMNILGPEDGYIDYSGLQLKTTAEGGTLLGNYLAIRAYRNELENRMIGQPPIADLFWRVSTPSAANCFYDPSTNSINILPGFINPTDWWDGITEMQILGGIGTVIGHELGHAFDFAGSQLNAYGENTAILHEDDLQDFLSRVDRIVEYYNSIHVLDGVHADGNKLKMENAADLAGMRTALSLAASKENADLEAFFRMNAGMYLQTVDYYSFMFMLVQDTHAPAYLRVNVVCQMMPEFAETFGVKEGDGMYVKPEDRLVIWGK